MDRVCPLLGLQSDRRTAVDGVDAAHRCHAEATPMALERDLQARLCLTAGHDRCERYLSHAARHGGVTPGRPGVVDGLVTTRMLIAPDPAWRGIAGRARRPGSRRVAAVGAAGLALAVGGAAVANGIVGGPASPAASDPSPSAVPSSTIAATSSPSGTPLPSASPRTRATPTATASAMPTASPVPTQAPTAVPTAVPTPEPPAAQTYVVAEDDTLASIAERFGTTVGALQAANDIDDPDEIVIGDLLVIP